MRGLLFFHVESAGHAFDDRIKTLLFADQKNHEAAYHVESVRVRTGAQEDSLQLGEETVWNIRTGAMGDIADIKTQVDLAHQLSNYLYGKIVKNGDTGCSAVFVSNGEAAVGTATVQISRLISMYLCTLYPVRIHIFLLQDQFVFRDTRVARLMKQVEMSNAVHPAFYTSQYMLPWEETDGARENSRQAFMALVKTMMMANADPMLLSGVGQPKWIETAAIRRLESPVERITNVVFRYLSAHFADSVLTPAVASESAAVIPPKEAKDCVRRLEGYVNEIERTTLLPTMQDLMCIMPLRNPNASGKLDDGISADKAWDMIFNIYGHEKGSELQHMLNPSLEELEEQYSRFGVSLAAELLRQVMQLARTSGQDFATIPHLIKQIGDSLTKQKEHSGAAAAEDLQYDHGLFMGKEKKEAIAMAKARHFYLSTVYRAASSRLSKKRKELRAEVMQDAVNQARQFIKNCIVILDNEYKAMVSKFLSRPVEQNCYDDHLNMAYDYWCSHSEAVEPITPSELYKLFTDEVFRMKAEDGARAICSALEEQILQRTMIAVDSIRVNIDSFFSELNFRTQLLQKQGMAGDLNNPLLTYLNGQVAHSPLLYKAKAGDNFGVQAKALIFHVAGADEFVSMAKNSGLTVVNDPYEKGVQQVVKYAGDSLDDVLVYSGNVGQPNEPQM